MDVYWDEHTERRRSRVLLVIVVGLVMAIGIAALVVVIGGAA